MLTPCIAYASLTITCMICSYMMVFRIIKHEVIKKNMLENVETNFKYFHFYEIISDEDLEDFDEEFKEKWKAWKKIEKSQMRLSAAFLMYFLAAIIFNYCIDYGEGIGSFDLKRLLVSLVGFVLFALFSTRQPFSRILLGQNAPNLEFWMAVICFIAFVCFFIDLFLLTTCCLFVIVIAVTIQLKLNNINLDYLILSIFWHGLSRYI